MLFAEINPFVQSLEHILGFILVLVALSLLWVITAGLGAFFAKKTAEPELTSDWVDSSGPTEEEVAAITAVIMSLMGPRGQIVSIRSNAKDWNREGRREHFASHRLR